MNSPIFWILGIWSVFRIGQWLVRRRTPNQGDRPPVPKSIILFGLAVSFAVLAAVVAVLILAPPDLAWIGIAILVISHEFRRWLWSQDWSSQPATLDIRDAQ
jgi:L-asparagine transporter-like permease